MSCTALPFCRASTVSFYLRQRLSVRSRSDRVYRGWVRYGAAQAATRVLAGRADSCWARRASQRIFAALKWWCGIVRRSEGFVERSAERKLAKALVMWRLNARNDRSERVHAEQAARIEQLQTELTGAATVMLLKAVITAFASVCLPFLAVPLRSQPT
eukprot:SAG22_NODE_5795_length_951_cov_1.267606_1_plen_157_part_10